MRGKSKLEMMCAGAHPSTKGRHVFSRLPQTFPKCSPCVYSSVRASGKGGEAGRKKRRERHSSSFDKYKASPSSRCLSPLVVGEY